MLYYSHFLIKIKLYFEKKSYIMKKIMLHYYQL